MSQVKSIKIKDDRPAKVYSFKAQLSPEQIATVQGWLNGLNRQFNEGLAVLSEAEQLDWRQKAWGDRAAQFPSMAVRWRKSKAGRYSLVGCGVRTRKSDGAKYCRIADYHWQPLPDKSLVKEGRIAQLRAYAIDCRSEKNYSHEVVSPVPAVCRDGCIDVLKKAWKGYKDPKLAARRPKFKNQDRPVKSLIYLSGRNNVTVAQVGDNAWVKLPSLAPFKVKGYFKRFCGGLDYSKVALVQDGGDWFVQFTARYTPAVEPSGEVRFVGVDPGIKAVVATSDGHVVQPRRKPNKLKRRLKRLQRKLARQQRGSKGSEKTQALQATTHAKIRRQRKAFNAKLADWLGRFNVAFEGSALPNMTRKAKPKPSADGKGWERNNAKAKSGLNRELLDNGLGQIRKLTEGRCKTRGKSFIKTADRDVRYSSQRCHCCREMGKRPSQEKFVCLNRGCRLHGIAQHADVNAAKNHRQAGYSIPLGIYPSAMGEVMGAESGATLAGQPGSRPMVPMVPEASETTPLPSVEQSTQGSESVKDDATPLTGETLESKAIQLAMLEDPPCANRGKGSRAKRAKPTGKSAKPSEVLAASAQKAQQLSLWDARPAG